MKDLNSSLTFNNINSNVKTNWLDKVYPIYDTLRLQIYIILKAIIYIILYHDKRKIQKGKSCCFQKLNHTQVNVY